MAKRKRKGKLKWIIIIVIILGIAGFITYKEMNKKPEGIEVTTGKSSRGDITSIVTATGKIFPEVEVKITSEVSGEIIQLPVVDGMGVGKGDLLVAVNPEILEARVKQQEASLSAQKASAAEARAQLLKAELDLKRTQSLFDQGFATQDELDRDSTNLEISKARLEAANYRIEQSEMQLQETQENLDNASTYAPMDGTITALNLEIGDRVSGTGQFSQGTEIMRVADLTTMEVRVDVSEAEIVDVKVGDLAEIEIDALPDETFNGTVTEIANSARTNRNNQEQLTTFQVKVRLDDPDSRYRPGMTATADIKTKTVEDAILVPLQAVTVRPKSEVRKQLKSENGENEDSEEDKEEEPEENNNNNGEPERDELQRLVFIVKDGKSIMTLVETGIADKRNIEITDGLEADTKIVTGSYGVLTRRLRHNSDIQEKGNPNQNNQG